MDSQVHERCLDDELVGSRAQDVEFKTLSQRKAGKEGPVSDCIACSFTHVMYGMRLCIRGEKEIDNVTKLIDTMPKLTHSEHKMGVTFDRGYGKLKMVKAVSES